MDDFEFDLTSDFKGYNSSRDRTNIKDGYMVRGSKNVYKKLSGNVANRFGLKRRGAADSTVAGIKSSYEWKSSLNSTRALRVIGPTVAGGDARLQVESKIADGDTPVWYDLLLTSTLLNPALTYTRFVFDSWWEQLDQKDRLVFVRGSNHILHWSGGITKVSGGTAAGGSGAVLSNNIGSAGSGYSSGDLIYITGGPTGTGCIISVTSINGTGGVTSIAGGLLAAGGDYVAGTTYSTSTNGSGSGFTLLVNTVTTTATLTKSDPTTTWRQDGFSVNSLSSTLADKKFILNGVEYTYSGGEDSATIYGVTPDPSGIAVNSIAIQSVLSQTSLDPNDPITNYNADFIKTLGNQLFVGSYTAKIIYISADETVAGDLGFTNLSNAGSRVVGDPDFLILDSPPNGMIQRDGKMYVSGGISDWYIVTPNNPLPVSQSVSGTTTFIVTKVEKIPGTGLSGALAHEFIDVYGNNIIYLAQDNQVRTIGIFKNVFDIRFPSLSQDIQDELHDEDFTGGHLRAIGEYIHITAPIAGRDYMYQSREKVDLDGNVSSEKLWHAPHIRSAARVAVIDGVTYIHSSANPQVYQIWDTGQWKDDSPTDEDLSYTSVLVTNYKHIASKSGVRRQGKLSANMFFTEGYIAEGSPLYANIYFDYQGSEDIQNVTINSIGSPAHLYTGRSATSLGDSSLGDNPLGDGLTPESNDQERLAKFRDIADLTPVDCFEYFFEIYSFDVSSRWEILAAGLNPKLSPLQAVELRT